MLGGDVADEALKPADERLPRLLVAQVGGRAAERVDLLDVDGLDQVGARREVPVQRPDADVRAARDLLQRRRGVLLGERVTRRRDELVVVAPRIGAPGTAGEARLLDVNCGHCVTRLAKRREPPYTSS